MVSHTLPVFVTYISKAIVCLYNKKTSPEAPLYYVQKICQLTVTQFHLRTNLTRHEPTFGFIKNLHSSSYLQPSCMHEWRLTSYSFKKTRWVQTKLFWSHWAFLELTSPTRQFKTARTVQTKLKPKTDQGISSSIYLWTVWLLDWNKVYWNVVPRGNILLPGPDYKSSTAYWQFP